MEEECQRIVTNYDLQPKWDAATRLQDIIHQEVEELAYHSAKRLSINFPSGMKARRATPMLGFLGGIIGPVTGLLTYENGEMMDSKINDVNQAQANLPHLVRTQTHLVRSQLEHIHKTVEEQETQMYCLKSKLLSTMTHTDELATSIDHITLTQTITRFLYSMEQGIDNYLRSANQLIDVVYAAREGKLHPLLLTSQQLEPIFRDIQDHSPKTILPLSGPHISVEELAQISETTVICKNGTLQVIIDNPLLDIAEYTLYEMHALPVQQPITVFPGSNL